MPTTPTPLAEARAALAVLSPPTSLVETLAWPAAADRRERLRSLGLPRVLVLAADAAPPLVWDDLEDWVREPVDAAELQARSQRVQRAAVASARTGAPAPVAVDAGGIAHVGAALVDVGMAAAPVLAALVARLDQPVRRAHLELAAPEALAPGGLDSLVRSLRRRLRAHGVRIEAAGADALVCFLVEPTEVAR